MAQGFAHREQHGIGIQAREGLALAVAISPAEGEQIAQDHLATVGFLAGGLEGEPLGVAEPLLLAQRMVQAQAHAGERIAQFMGDGGRKSIELQDGLLVLHVQIVEAQIDGREHAHAIEDLPGFDPNG